MRKGDAGSGTLAASFGVTAFLGFVFLAVQLMTNLYATSTVTAVAYDAARSVAATGHRPTALGVARAEAQARHRLGEIGRRTTFDWNFDDPASVRLRVEVDAPRVLPRSLAEGVGFDEIDRTVVVRIEEAIP